MSEKDREMNDKIEDSQLKIDEVLANFFIKKIIDEKKSLQDSKKKHKKKSKHKHRHHYSSSHSDSDNNSDKSSKSKNIKHKKSSKHRSSSRSSHHSNDKSKQLHRRCKSSSCDSSSQSDSHLKKKRKRSCSPTSDKNDRKQTDSHKERKKKSDKIGTNEKDLLGKKGNSISANCSRELGMLLEESETFGCSLPPASALDINSVTEPYENSSLNTADNSKFRNDVSKVCVLGKSFVTVETKTESTVGKTTEPVSVSSSCEIASPFMTVTSSLPSISLDSVKLSLPDIHSISSEVNSSCKITSDNSKDLESLPEQKRLLEKLKKHEELYKDLEFAKLKTKVKQSESCKENSREEKQEESGYLSESPDHHERNKYKKHSKESSSGNSKDGGHHHRKHKDKKEREGKHSRDATPEHSRKTQKNRNEEKRYKEKISRESTPQRRDRSEDRKHREKRSREATPDRRERKRHRNKRSRETTPEFRDRSEDRRYKEKRSRETTPEHGHHRYRRSSRDRHTNSHHSESLDTKEKFDKAKLLEIARRNAVSLLEKGALPGVFKSDTLKKEVAASLKAGGKSVQELTEFCTALSKKENLADDPDGTGNQDDEQPFIRNPFKLRETSEIKLNIRNSVPIPVESHAEKVAKNVKVLSQQFPVSSGNQHRQKELEWIPVEKEPEQKAARQSNMKQQNIPAVQTAVIKSDQTIISGSSQAVEATSQVVAPVSSDNSVFQPSIPHTGNSGFLGSATIPGPPQPPSQGLQGFTQVSASTQYPHSGDINSIISRRYKAVLRLKENPNDYDALRELHEAETQAQSWIQSQLVPGQFTGSTNAKVLSAQELSGPRPVWNKKDALTRAAPVSEGKGMSLLKKMGWNPGEGLGKNKEGTLEPLSISIKMDKKGFLAQDEGVPKPKPLPAIPDINKKHPVSILMELCSKNKWLPPTYTVIFESGPIHKRNYLFKVEVDNVEYKPAVSRPNKKQAKAECALVCLQALGVLPVDYKLP